MDWSMVHFHPIQFRIQQIFKLRPGAHQLIVASDAALPPPPRRRASWRRAAEAEHQWFLSFVFYNGCSFHCTNRYPASRPKREMCGSLLYSTHMKEKNEENLSFDLKPDVVTLLLLVRRAADSSCCRAPARTLPAPAIRELAEPANSYVLPVHEQQPSGRSRTPKSDPFKRPF